MPQVRMVLMHGVALRRQVAAYCTVERTAVAAMQLDDETDAEVLLQILQIQGQLDILGMPGCDLFLWIQNKVRCTIAYQT